jgi:hypothetical protein
MLMPTLRCVRRDETDTEHFASSPGGPPLALPGLSVPVTARLCAWLADVPAIVAGEGCWGGTGRAESRGGPPGKVTLGKLLVEQFADADAEWSLEKNLNILAKAYYLRLVSGDRSEAEWLEEQKQETRNKRVISD